MLGYSGSMPSISIHALREESDEVKALRDYLDTISIHALREESDGWRPETHRQRLISIHALREESDSKCRVLGNRCIYFNPRSP